MSTQSKTQIRDTEEISQRHRLKELLNRRREVLDTRDRVIEALEYGQIGRRRAVSIYSEKLTGLILDIYPMFSWAERGEFYFREVELDSLAIRPPADLRQSVAQSSPQPDAKPVSIIGLGWFIDNDIAVTQRFRGYRGESVRQTTVTQTKTLPFRTVDNGVQTVVQFLHEVDVDVQFDDSADEAAGGYDVIEDYQDEMGIDAEEILE